MKEKQLPLYLFAKFADNTNQLLKLPLTTNGLQPNRQQNL